jgi:hypothetical protein
MFQTAIQEMNLCSFQIIAPIVARATMLLQHVQHLLFGLDIANMSAPFISHAGPEL